MRLFGTDRSTKHFVFFVKCAAVLLGFRLPFLCAHWLATTERGDICSTPIYLSFRHWPVGAQDRY